MKRVEVNRPEYRQPARVFDLIMDDGGNVYVEIKFPGSSAIRVNIKEELMKLQAMNANG